MSESTDTNRWGVLGIAGVLSLCCLGATTLAGGAALTGGSIASATVVNGAVGGIGELLVTGLATALPLLVIGIAIHYRISHS